MGSSAEQWKTLGICVLGVCLVVPALAKVSVTLSQPEPPTPLHYWRFEPEPGFLEDSIGNAGLAVISPGIEPVNIPDGARGENFPAVIGVSRDANSTAADCRKSLGSLACPDAIPIDKAFTIEAFVRADNLTPIKGWGKSILAAQGTKLY